MNAPGGIPPACTASVIQSRRKGQLLYLLSPCKLQCAACGSQLCDESEPRLLARIPRKPRSRLHSARLDCSLHRETSRATRAVNSVAERNKAVQPRWIGG